MVKKKDESQLVNGEVSEGPTNAPGREITPMMDASIVRPAISPVQAKENWQLYTKLCEAILSPTDYYTMTRFLGPGKGSEKKAYKLKSAWRKLATAFNLSVEIRQEEKEVREDGSFVVKIIARVVAPNGRFVEGTGSCSSKERNFAHLEHDVRAQAETRAKNRAIADMIGGGEVSAEEVLQMEQAQQEQCPRDHEALPEKIVSTVGKNKGRPYKKCPSCKFFEWMDEDLDSQPLGETESGVPTG